MDGHWKGKYGSLKYIIDYLQCSTAYKQNNFSSLGVNISGTFTCFLPILSSTILHLHAIYPSHSFIPCISSLVLLGLPYLSYFLLQYSVQLGVMRVYSVYSWIRIRTFLISFQLTFQVIRTTAVVHPEMLRNGSVMVRTCNYMDCVFQKFSHFFFFSIT